MISPPFRSCYLIIEYKSLSPATHPWINSMQLFKGDKLNVYPIINMTEISETSFILNVRRRNRRELFFKEGAFNFRRFEICSSEG